MESIKERLAALREEMRKEGIRFYMIPTSDYHNSEYVNDYFKMREYYSGFTGSNGTLVVGADKAGLWTDGRYFIQAQKELEGSGIELFRMMEDGVPDIPEFLENEMKEEEILAFDGRTVSCKEGLKLEKKLAPKNAHIQFETDMAGRLWKERPTLPKNDILILPKELCGKSTSEKLKEARKKMSEVEAKYWLLSKLDDLMWIMNIRGKDIECNPVALSYAFISADMVYFFVQKEEVTEEFTKYAKDNGIELRDYEEISTFLKAFPYEGTVLIDKNNVNYTLYKIVSKQAKVVEEENPTEYLKAVKNETELERMRDVYLKDSAAVVKFIYWVKKNAGKVKMDELSAAEYIDNLRKKIDGFIDLSFPTISAYKENAAMMHYEASAEECKEISEDGMLLVDSGGQYMGGTTDVTRTIVLGAITDEVKMHFTKVAVGMLRLTDAKFLYGCTGRNLDILARQPLWDIGIDYKCGTGHGIGYILNVHEGPQSIRWRFAEGAKEAIIEEGMVISNEPGVYMEGSHGIRTENVMAAVKREKNGDGQFMGFETFTFVPIDLDAIDTAYMQAEDIERLNRYHKVVYEKISGLLSAEEREWLAEVTKAV